MWSQINKGVLVVILLKEKEKQYNSHPFRVIIKDRRYLLKVNKYHSHTVIRI